MESSERVELESTDPPTESAKTPLAPPANAHLPRWTERKLTTALSSLVALSFLALIIAINALARSANSSVETPHSILRPCQNAAVAVRRNVKTLTQAEKRKLVDSLKQMKTVPSAYNDEMNAYDYFVDLHKRATVPNTHVHAGWYFYPWHRAMLYRFHKELHRVTGDPSISFPYWDWADKDSSASLFDITYMGPRGGRAEDGFILYEGNFARGNWTLAVTTLPEEKATSSLLRTPGHGLQMCEDIASSGRDLWLLDTKYNSRDVDKNRLAGPFVYLPPDGPPSNTTKFLQPDPANNFVDWEDLSGVRKYTDTDSNMSLRCNHYAALLPTEADYTRCDKLHSYTTRDKNKLGDIEPNNPFATTKDFNNSNSVYWRACFEGIDPGDRIAKGLERIGASLHPPHGATHTYMGGSLASPSSPNDPIFWHLHSNVDRKFAEWQIVNGNDWFLSGPMNDKLDEALPLMDDNEPMTLRQALDSQKMGFTYDTVCG